MQYTLTKQVAARTNTQTYSVGLHADPHMYGTQRARLACFLFVLDLSSWTLLLFSRLFQHLRRAGHHDRLWTVLAAFPE